MDKGKRPVEIMHIVPRVGEEASGPSYTVVRLCRELYAIGENLRLVALDGNGGSETIPFLETYPMRPMFRRLGLSPRMHGRLVGAAEHADILHNHSLWMMPNVYPGWAVRGKSCRLVVSPRGTLSRWALKRSAWKKRIFWALLQGPAVRRASCFHATAEHEYEDIRSAGLRGQPICVIPNGIDVPEMKSKPAAPSRVLLFLGRIHPVKGIDMLLGAWAAVAHRFPEWELRIAGPDNDGYLPKMQETAKELGLKRVVFCGPLYGEAKQAAYQEADLYVLPTHTENFGVTVAESLAAGTPAIVSKGAPWSGLEENGAGWWIEIGVDPLVACLENALSRSPGELTSMGRAGREWMMRNYSWPKIGRMMHMTYRWLLKGGETPAWVRLD
ncbi:MAG TPA: glycosyltransferase [Syntrophobacteraceae bacterium]|nr:glycosyltransferase [Syntrophobacteraceae bacterium]